jgi:ribosomal protein S18 acetylase RimI-like enzyme
MEVDGVQGLVNSDHAAIVSADNQASVGLLIRLGFQREGKINIEPDRDPVDLYVMHRETRVMLPGA